MESNLSQVVVRFLEHAYIVSERNWNVNHFFKFDRNRQHGGQDFNPLPEQRPTKIGDEGNLVTKHG